MPALTIDLPTADAGLAVFEAALSEADISATLRPPKSQGV